MSSPPRLRPLHRWEIGTAGDLERFRVLHRCGGRVLPIAVLDGQPLPKTTFGCTGCAATWKLSTFAGFTEAELAQRFSVERPAAAEPETFALVWAWADSSRSAWVTFLAHPATGEERVRL